MTYPSIVRARFIERVNRFVARVDRDGTIETVHVKNTGRLRELLTPGADVVLAVSDNPARKTKYDLIAVYKPGLGLVNIDSQIANDAAAEWLRARYPRAVIRREVTKGASRFDFCIETDGRTIYLEVKGCTLERDGIARFPDAPTERGIKHIRELADCVREGYGACLLFVVQMKGVRCLQPNDETHAAFGAALREAAAAGVEVLAVDCLVSENAIVPDAPVAVDLT